MIKITVPDYIGKELKKVLDNTKKKRSALHSIHIKSGNELHFSDGKILFWAVGLHCGEISNGAYSVISLIKQGKYCYNIIVDAIPEVNLDTERIINDYKYKQEEGFLCNETIHTLNVYRILQQAQCLVDHDRLPFAGESFTVYPHIDKAKRANGIIGEYNSTFKFMLMGLKQD